MNAPTLPKPELRGTGTVRYRCRACGDQMDPDRAVIRDGHSWHPEHAPKEGETWQQTRG